MWRPPLIISTHLLDLTPAAQALLLFPKLKPVAKPILSSEARTVDEVTARMQAHNDLSVSFQTLAQSLESESRGSDHHTSKIERSHFNPELYLSSHRMSSKSKLSPKISASIYHSDDAEHESVQDHVIEQITRVSVANGNGTASADQRCDQMCVS